MESGGGGSSDGASSSYRSEQDREFLQVDCARYGGGKDRPPAGAKEGALPRNTGQRGGFCKRAGLDGVAGVVELEVSIDKPTSWTSCLDMRVKEVGSFKAKTHFARLLDAVEKGEKIYITRRGKRVAQLTASEEPKRAKFGCAKGPGFYMASDFDAPLEDFKEYM